MQLVSDGSIEPMSLHTNRLAARPRAASTSRRLLLRLVPVALAITLAVRMRSLVSGPAVSVTDATAWSGGTSMFGIVTPSGRASMPMWIGPL